MIEELRSRLLHCNVNIWLSAAFALGFLVIIPVSSALLFSIHDLFEVQGLLYWALALLLSSPVIFCIRSYRRAKERLRVWEEIRDFIPIANEHNTYDKCLRMDWEELQDNEREKEELKNKLQLLSKREQEIVETIETFWTRGLKKF